MGRPYDRYAAVYDRTGQCDFALEAWADTRLLLRELSWAGRDVLDLACGTGAVVARMRADGYRASGLDLARPMLLAGRERCADAPLIVGDMRRLPLADECLDLVTCFYDSLNYLADPAELTATFREVGRTLRPGGLFVFDLNTPHTLRNHWLGTCQTSLDEACSYVWQATWDPDREVSSLRAVFFQRGPDGRYDRFEEIHDERGFSPEELTAAAAAGGLTAVWAEDLQTGRRPTRLSRRVGYAYRRPGR